MSNNIKYWKGEEELVKDPAFLASRKNEFPDALPLDEVLGEEGVELNSNRRDFLKFFGFSVTAVALAACYKTKVRHAVPYLVKPEDVTPGVASYYASTCGACSAACESVVKVREGRPIKLDGKTGADIKNGGLCATGQASILSLYDNERLADPIANGKEAKDWAKLDESVTAKLNEIDSAKGRIVILSSTIHSPSTLKAIEDFKAKYKTAEHITYDAVSYSGIVQANKDDFGKAALPAYKFGNAEVIVSFGADFLGSWISPVEFAKAYATNRIPTKDKVMSKHIQFESNLSMTGTNADDRFPMKASDEGKYLASLHNYIAEKTGGKMIAMPNAELAGNSIKKTADILLNAKGKSLVISGSNNVAVQKVVNSINMMLENYGKTIDIVNHSNQYKGIDADTDNLLKDIKSGSVAGIIFYGTNPVYNHDTAGWTEGIKKAKLSVSFASTKDETAGLCNYVCPDNHFLESWGDAEPRSGEFQFIQPTITNVFNTRQAQVSLLTWAGVSLAVENDHLKNKGILTQKLAGAPYYHYMRKLWAEKLGEKDFDKSFNSCLHDGVYSVKPAEAKTPAYSGNVTELASALSGGKQGIDLVLYTNIAVRDGAHGNNPWLHELPDPVSKVCWDNYVSLPKQLAVKLGLRDGDTVNVKSGNVSLSNVPALIQPGQANNTVGLALGFGRTAAGKVGGSKEKGFDTVGVNAYPLLSAAGRNWVVSGVEITKGDGTYALAQTQTHHSIEGRDLVRESTFAEWQKNPQAGNDKEKTHVYTIWEKRDYRKDGSPNHLWAMAIDLNACTGCGSCVVSCSIENNVPVVGRDEIRLRREMTWIRIDRYYSFRNNNSDKEIEGNYVTREKEIAKFDKADKGDYDHWEKIKVVHQPMMCQHCSQAPCETVCPVLATTHSTEGLNQMTYNRCIGTKYCGNNCPYKVRRFNWFRYNDNDKFDFHFNNPLGKMVINPDVTVRTRGVMEKCSFCVQRIQEAKLTAKREGKTPKDVEVRTACQRACPSNAIVFGDLHNPDSEISKLYKNERGFGVLEEINVQSSVKYMTKIRNTETV